MATVLLLFAIMLVLVVLGVPLVYAIGVAATAIILGQGQMNPTLLPSRLYAGVDSFVLVAIPFFLLAAELLARGGLMVRIIHVSRLLLGRIRGGLAQVCRDLLEQVPEVTLYVNEGNEAALALYRSMGFRRISDWRTTVVWRD